MQVSYFCQGSDAFLGRVDRESMPQQTLLELFIADIERAHEICYDLENPDDVCEWQGVSCDAEGNVTEFSWNWKFKDGKGSIDMLYLPLTIRQVNMQCNALGGTVDLRCLPRSLEELDIGTNNFTGTLELTELPNNLRKLSLDENAFSGSVNLTQLPKVMTDLSLSSNALVGRVDLENLPASLEYLALQKNNFSGTVFLCQAQKKIVNLANNKNLTVLDDYSSSI
ncbi:leucine-rich repeat protein [Perkinsela sp. CCAP 1560/4]|nr:leucine-rich repeat protein [Perkinsela sp. CCAP 1560/4]|eukprot:KNH07965.1 leucine-rich repeat protein [Perkinsela sp. CCAP 1560/4]